MILLLALPFALLFRLPYLIFWDVFYNADYALIGLMGRHFLKGEFSFYAWGAAYHANIEPLLMMPVFKFLGATPQSASLIPAFFSLALIALYYRYVSRVCGPWVAGIAALLAAAPSPFFLATAVRNSDYPEIFCLGLVHFMLYDRIRCGDLRPKIYWALGLVAGFSWFYLKVIFIFWLALAFVIGLYALTPERIARLRAYFQNYSLRRFWNEALLLRLADIKPTLRYALAALNLYNAVNFSLAVWLWFHGPFVKPLGRIVVKIDFWPLFQSSVQMAALAAIAANGQTLVSWAKAQAKMKTSRGLVFGFLLGYSPAVVGALLGQSADSRNGLANSKELLRNFNLISSELLPQIAGISDSKILMGISVALVGLSFLFVLVKGAQIFLNRWRENAEIPRYAPLLALAFANLLLGMTYDRLINVSTLRYFLPLWFVFPVALGLLFDRGARRWWVWPALFVLLLNSAQSHLNALAMHESPHALEPVVERLKQKGITGGYADYWIAMLGTFLSQEKVVLAPVEETDRAPALTSYVRSLDRAAWVGDYPVFIDGKLAVKDLRYDVTGQDWVGNVLILYLKKA